MPTDGARLLDLGFREEETPGFYSALTAGNEDKARLFAGLRDAGVAFERGREWSPAEVFERLRELGLVTGRFRSISWRGPEQWITREEE